MSPTRTLFPPNLGLALALALSAAACGGRGDGPSEHGEGHHAHGHAEGPHAAGPLRCANCGMRVESDSRWRAGGESADGDALAFDTPKCLFRYRQEVGEVREPWVIEYYSQERRPAADLLYVRGTDLQGPMGADLVPVDGREAAERLRDDHGGDAILAFDEVTAPIARSLFGA